MTEPNIDKCDWIPESDRARLRELAAEWTGPGKGYVLIIQPPEPGRGGFTVFQPCIDPEHGKRPSETATTGR
jgi:hypothetical protein